MIKSGAFDRLLLRPRSAAFQVAAHEVQIRRIARLIVGFSVMFWASSALSVEWSVARFALLGAALIGGTCLFCGLYVLSATLSFWTIESLEIINCVTDGGRETAQYPLSIYRPWFRRFFTFAIPLACFSYYPVLAILGRPDPLGAPDWFLWTAPALGIVFLIICLQVWRIGVRHYCSTGS